MTFFKIRLRFASYSSANRTEKNIISIIKKTKDKDFLMADELVTKEVNFLNYYVEKIDYEYNEEDVLVNKNTSYWFLSTKNTSVGLSPDFDKEKWTLVGNLPEDVNKLKEVTKDDSQTSKVTEVLTYYYKWYVENKVFPERINGICVTCIHHTTENPYMAKKMPKENHKYICEAQKSLRSIRANKDFHYCKAYIKKDFIEGNDIYEECYEHNNFGECTKYEPIVHSVTIDPPVIEQEGNTVSIQTSTDEASVFYTITEDDPVVAGIEYTAPFDITEDVTIHAVAFKNGEYSSVSERFCEYVDF